MSDFLKDITGPSDLNKLNDKQLKELAVEIRQLLLTTVSGTGGHLASNLGTVELTLALHSVFSSPQDQIVWDVGHQSYVHKIITGRKDQFQTLRQYDGISGFPKPEESIHDAFATGHSSTSISAALGLAKGRDLKGETHKVVAVIGDGSLTGGMAFEALNHLGHLQTDLIVVLNDNEMSISKNVGAFSKYLTRLRNNPGYRRLKIEIQELLKKIPGVGGATVHYLKKFEDSLAFLVIPGMIFEELGISYLGPIDGHHLGELKRSLKQAKERGGPVLVHVLTTKGKGYEHAEKNPQRFHGTGPFTVSSGEKLGPDESPGYTQVFSDTLMELAGRDPRILAITAAMADGTGLEQFAKRYPQRFLDVGIAEEHAVTLAAGLAKQGFRPVVAIYSTFLQRSYDQIIHDVCLQKLPVLFMLDRAGLVGPDGPTHHGVFDLSYLRHIPNLTVMAPKNGSEFRNMIYSALQYDGPVAIRYPKRDSLMYDTDEEFKLLPEGKGEILLSGQKTAILAVGAMVEPALQAARLLRPTGQDCAVVNARFIKPLDHQLLLDLVRHYQNIVVVEENVVAGGFGSAVLEFYNEKEIRSVNIKLLGLPDRFVGHGATELLLQDYGLDAAGICRTIRALSLPKVRKRVK